MAGSLCRHAMARHAVADLPRIDGHAYSSCVIRALILDADGVIIDGAPASVTFARELGITPAMTGSFFSGPFRDCLVGAADLKECIAPHLSGWGWRGSVQGFLDYWFEVEHHLDEGLLAEVARHRAAGTRCYIATNQERYRTEYIRDAMALGDRFDAIFSSAYVGHTKDDRQFLDQLKRELAPIRADEMLFWDDGPVNGETAREAGLRAELYTNLEAFRELTNRYLAS